MKSKILLIVIVLFLFTIQSALCQNKKYSIQIEINEIKNDKGNIVLQLKLSTDSLDIGRIVKIQNHKCIFEIDSLNAGIYSIRYFHDENTNNKLDTNWLGIPKEGYGFSNNAVSTFGAPSEEERAFELKGNLKIRLTPKY